MKPDESNDRRVGTPLVPQRSLLHNTPMVPARDASAQVAAAGIARGQLDRIYGGSATTAPQTTPATNEPATSEQRSLETTNPYERTQTNLAHVQAEQWKQYHSAWQEYYQKYYERYYVGQVYRAHQALETRAHNTTTDQTIQSPEPLSTETVSPDEAMYDLRSKLLGKMQNSAQKARHSRHFVPITAAICVVLLFAFLQYNRLLIANVQAYISPGDIDPANIIIDPSTDVAVSPQPKLIIPKINVDVPADYNTTPDYNAQMKAMENGVAWFGIPGADSHPGQIGNTVLSGHSSNDIIDQGDYKFIFARLDHLSKGDSIFLNYQGKRYTYTVTKQEVVKPTEVSKLVYPTNKPILTLITCTPLGTSRNRLLVTAEQVSPDPANALPAPASASNGQPASIPGNSPTIVQRIFGNNSQ